MEHGDTPERESGDDSYPSAPLPPHERVWRHPSELGTGHMVVVEPSHGFGRSATAGVAIAGVVLVATMARLMLPGDADTGSEFAVTVSTARQVITAPILGTDTVVDVSPPVEDTAVQVVPSIPGSSPASSLVAPSDTLITTITEPVDQPTQPPVEVTASVETTPSTSRPDDASIPMRTALLQPDPAATPALAIEVEPDTLFVTTSAAVGDARTLTVELPSGVLLVADVVLLDEEAGIAVLLADAADGTDTNATLPPASGSALEPGLEVVLLPSDEADQPTSAVVGEADLETGARELMYEGGATEGSIIVDSDGNLIGLCTSSGEKMWIVPAAALEAAVEASAHIAEGDAWLGVRGVRGDDGGVSVESVTVDSPAEESGLLAGDLIVEMDGSPVMSLADLALDLSRRRPGDSVVIGIDRAGVSVQVAVVLGTRPA